jgi:hypothetical protein
VLTTTLLAAAGGQLAIVASAPLESGCQSVVVCPHEPSVHAAITHTRKRERTRHLRRSEPVRVKPQVPELQIFNATYQMPDCA